MGARNLRRARAGWLLPLAALLILLPLIPGGRGESQPQRVAMGSREIRDLYEALLRRGPVGSYLPPAAVAADFEQTLDRDDIRPIYRPKFVAAEEADLAPTELVMGVEVAEHARAYPVTILRLREMVNDQIADTPLLISWCPLCYTGLVHDRRIEGRARVFGNQGALYKNAMTWWDHETESVWSQVSGKALYGPLAGTELRQIPASVGTWKAWVRAHPDTLVLATPEGLVSQPERQNPDFLIGVRLKDVAVGFDFRYVLHRGVVNDWVGDLPIAVYAREDRLIQVFSRRAGDAIVDLRVEDNLLVDQESGTFWNPTSGQGISGPLAEHSLSPVPWASSFDWAWKLHFPKSRFVGTTGPASP